MILRSEGMTGIHTHVRQVRGYLEKHGVRTVLLTPFSWGGALTAPLFGVRYLFEPWSGTLNVLWYRYWHEVFLRNALRRHLSTLGEAVVYTHDPLAARAALRARRGLHQRVVMAVHFPASEADEWVRNKRIKAGGAAFRIIQKQERPAISQLDGIVYVSQSTREDLLSRIPEAAIVPSTIIPNFLEPVEPPSEIEPLGDLVTVGRLDHVKNHSFLLEVVAKAKSAGTLLTLDIYGEGSCRKDLQQQASSLGIDEQVKFHGFRTDVRNFLPGYRAYVHAAIVEPFGLAILEAMAAGLPVVAGDVGGISELCDDGFGARFWTLDDPGKAASTLLELLGSEEERSTAGRLARERFQRDFNAEMVAPKLWAFLVCRSEGLVDAEESQ
jgi:glycosyltransferase involved in cell wall biosynthesis